MGSFGRKVRINSLIFFQNHLFFYYLLRNLPAFYLLSFIYFTGNGQYLPCIINRINDDRTYDLEFVNEYRWYGIQKNIDAKLVQTRGDLDKRRKG